MWSNAVVLVGPPAMAGRNLWTSVCLFFCLPVLPSRSFLRIGSLVFSAMQHSVRGACVDIYVFFFWTRCFLKNNFAHKMGKMGQKCIKFIGKFSHYFFLNLFYNESLYYLLYSGTDPIFGKNLVPEIWPKMLLASQITRFLD